MTSRNWERKSFVNDTTEPVRLRTHIECAGRWLKAGGKKVPKKNFSYVSTQFQRHCSTAYSSNRCSCSLHSCICTRTKHTANWVDPIRRRSLLNKICAHLTTEASSHRLTFVSSRRIFFCFVSTSLVSNIHNLYSYTSTQSNLQMLANTDEWIKCVSKRQYNFFIMLFTFFAAALAIAALFYDAFNFKLHHIQRVQQMALCCTME